MPLLENHRKTMYREGGNESMTEENSVKSPKPIHSKNQQRKNAAGVPVFDDDAALWAQFCRQKETDSPSFRDLMTDQSTSVAALALHKGEVFARPQKPTHGSTKITAMTVEREVDLHGLTATQATRRARSFLHTQKLRGSHLLRIITGKGLHSEGPAVLRDAIEAVVRELRGEKEIAGFWWESGKKETSGALLVRLR